MTKLAALAALGFSSLVACAAPATDGGGADDQAMTSSAQEAPAAAAPTSIEGSLMEVAGIGGESTGVAIMTTSGLYELILDDAERAAFVDGQKAKITGTVKTLSGVETHERKAIDVSAMLVCPASGTWVNCMPAIEDDTSEQDVAVLMAAAANEKLCANRTWLSANCEGVGFAD